MGARGRRSNPTARRPHKNRRLNARMRALQVVEGDPKWWNLVTGGACEEWPDEFCPERAAAWRLWRERIYGRFPSWLGRYGARPAGWWSFEAPRLLVRAWRKGKLSEAATDAMDDLEIVYWLDASKAERAQICEIWEQDARLLGARAAQFGVPAWFGQLEPPGPTVVAIEHARRPHRCATGSI
jgi:hypothetical protein